MGENNKIRKDNISMESWITVAHPSIVDFVSSAGYEWLVIDIEHTSVIR